MENKINLIEIESMLKENGFECAGNNLYKMSNDYLTAYISIDPDRDTVSFTLWTKEKFKGVYYSCWHPCNPNPLDKELERWLGQNSAYTDTFILVREKLAEIKEMCDRHWVGYDLNKILHISTQ